MNAQDYLKSGIDNFNKENYQAALNDLNQCIKLRNNNPVPTDYYYRAASNYYLENYQAAQTDIDYCIHLRNGNLLPWDYYWLSVIQYVLGKYLQALNSINLCIQLRKNIHEPWDYYYRAAINCNLGNNKAALADIGFCLKLRKDLNPWDSYWQGKSNYGLGLYDIALNNFKIALKIPVKKLNKSHEIPCYFWQGKAYQALKQPQAAQQNFNNVINLPAMVVYQYYYQGRSYYELGQYQKALIGLNQAIQKAENSAGGSAGVSEYYYWRGKTYFELGDDEGTIKDCQQAFSIDNKQEYKLLFEQAGRRRQEKQNQALEIAKAQAFSNALKKSWHFSPLAKAALAKLPRGNRLLDASEEDIGVAVREYQRCPVPGMDIKRVQIMYNPETNHGFELRLTLLQARANQPAFLPQWTKQPESAEKNQRTQTQQMIEKLSQPYQDSAYPAVKLLPLWHGTKRSIVDSILQTGYANLATTDSGYFGKGIYSTKEAKYAYQVYGKDGVIILNWVSFYSAYPVIWEDHDKKLLMAKGNYANYDAHFVPVVPPPGQINGSIYYPCKPGETHTYIETVVFDSSQCLPRYLVELQPSLPKDPFVSSLPLQKTSNEASKKTASNAPIKLSQNPHGSFAKIAQPPVSSSDKQEVLYEPPRRDLP